LVDNLVRNAIEALPDELGRENEITISLRENAGKPVLSVTDNGSGIPKEIQNRVFDLDFTTKAQRGTGLGLGIVKKICRDAGINLRLSSVEGSGTTFAMEFFGKDLGSDSKPIREDVV
jgi:signal transduction histidine kinase